jgi:hypothetical protein
VEIGKVIDSAAMLVGYCILSLAGAALLFVMLYGVGLAAYLALERMVKTFRSYRNVMEYVYYRRHFLAWRRRNPEAMAQEGRKAQ